MTKIEVVGKGRFV